MFVFDEMSLFRNLLHLLSECGAGDGSREHLRSASGHSSPGQRWLAAHFAAFLPALSSLGGYGSVKERLCIQTTIASAMPETTSSFFCAHRERNSFITLGFMVSNGCWDSRSSSAEAMSHAFIARSNPVLKWIFFSAHRTRNLWYSSAFTLRNPTSSISSVPGFSMPC